MSTSSLSEIDGRNISRTTHAPAHAHDVLPLPLMQIGRRRKRNDRLHPYSLSCHVLPFLSLHNLALLRLSRLALSSLTLFCLVLPRLVLPCMWCDDNLFCSCLAGVTFVPFHVALPLCACLQLPSDILVSVDLPYAVIPYHILPCPCFALLSFNCSSLALRCFSESIIIQLDNARQDLAS